MVNVWKYPVIFLTILISLVGLSLGLEYLLVAKLTVKIPDWLRFSAILPIVLSLGSTNLPEFMPDRVKRRLRWLHARAAMKQLYYFAGFQVLVIGVCSFLVVLYPHNHVVYLFDLVSNMLVLAFVGIYCLVMIRIVSN